MENALNELRGNIASVIRIKEGGGRSDDEEFDVD